jgi:hypothetical protein
MVKKENMATITITSLIVYVIFIALAILLYVGGLKTDPLQIRYTFWGNSLSDLGMITGYNGFLNLYSMVLFTIGTAMFGASFIPFNIAFPMLFKENKASKIIAFIAGIFGYAAAAGMILIAFTPHNFSDLIHLLHMVGVYTAYVSIFVSSVLYAVAIFLNKSVKNVYGIIIAIFCAVFLATLIIGLLGLGGDASNIVAQIGQKTGRGITVITYIVLCIPLLKSNE